MKKDAQDGKITLNRREFIVASSLGLGAGMAMGVFSAASAEKETNENKDPEAVDYRMLGKTGIKVSTVSMGVMNCRDFTVLRRAFDLGINFYDTARGYMGGRNEEVVAEALSGVRDKVFIQTKLRGGRPPADLRADLETSLKTLKTDYVDVLLIHNNRSIEQIAQEDQIAAYQQFKKEGKTRFIGFSTHSNEAELLNHAAKSGIWDVILVTYNFTIKPDLIAAVKKCSDAGIGIVAMKTQSPLLRKEDAPEPKPIEGMSLHQAALAAALTDKNVACAIPGVRTISEIEELAAVMRQKRVAFFDRKALNNYLWAVAGGTCTMCGACGDVCEKGVPARAFMRTLAYRDGYHDYELAKSSFDDINGSVYAAICESCASCSFRCAQKLAVRDRILDAAHTLA